MPHSDLDSSARSEYSRAPVLACTQGRNWSYHFFDGAEMYMSEAHDDVISWMMGCRAWPSVGDAGAGGLGGI